MPLECYLFVSLAVTPLVTVNLEPARGEVYATHLAQQLSFQGLRTVTSAEVAAVLGHERQLELLGCPDDTCRGLTIRTLGVDALLTGTVSKLGRQLKLDVRVLESGSGRPLGASSVSSTDDDDFLASLKVVAEQLATQTAARLGRKLLPNGTLELKRASSLKRLAWLPGVGALAGFAVGGVGLGLAHGSLSALDQRRQTGLVAGDPSGPLTASQADELARAGIQQQTLGWVGLAGGAALAAVAGGMFLFGGDEVVTAGVAFSPQHMTLSIAGAW